MAVTSTTATTAIDVCNRALVLIGASPMTFEDGTNEALVAVNLYEDTCRSALVNTRWRFASNQKVLGRLSDVLQDVLKLAMLCHLTHYMFIH